MMDLVGVLQQKNKELEDRNALLESLRDAVFHLQLIEKSGKSHLSQEFRMAVEHLYAEANALDAKLEGKK